jgi:hypothetical protein
MAVSRTMSDRERQLWTEYVEQRERREAGEAAARGVEEDKRAFVFDTSVAPALI